MADLVWLIPWYGVGDSPNESSTLEAQLAREVGPRHVLRGVGASLIARRQDNDDCLFLLADGRYANVHLTWCSSEEPDPRWPATCVYNTLEEWAAKVMQPAHEDWLTDEED